jgi:DNA-binding XRE family transcriptional regulator
MSISKGAKSAVSEPAGSLDDYLRQLPPALLTPAQTARALGVSKRTLNNWSNARLIPRIEVSKRCTRYHLGRVLQALEKLEQREVGR